MAQTQFWWDVKGPKQSECWRGHKRSQGRHSVGLSKKFGGSNKSFCRDQGSNDWNTTVKPNTREKAIIEGDSLNIINCLRGSSEANWSIQEMMDRAKEGIRRIPLSEVRHIFHKGNSTVGAMANIGIRVQEFNSWESDFLSQLLEIARLKQNEQMCPHRQGRLPHNTSGVLPTGQLVFQSNHGKT